MSLPERLTIAVFQWALDREDPARNLDAVDRLFSQLEVFPQAPHLVVLPEMWSRSFCGRHLVEEAALLEARLSFCAERARRHRCWIAAGTLPEPAGDGKVYNTFFLLDTTGEVRQTYRKIHLYPNTSEPKYFAPGSALPEPLDLGSWKIGVGVCFDLRFPELFRAQVKRGVNLFLCPVQFPSSGAETLSVLSRARAMENLAGVVVANRWGREGPHGFGGGSAIIGPRGNALASVGEGEGIACTDLSADKIVLLREEHPYLASARVLHGDVCG